MICRTLVLAVVGQDYLRASLQVSPATALVAIARLFTSEAANRRINILFALCLIGVGVWMLVPALKA